jgi:hypothetical protein
MSLWIGVYPTPFLRYIEQPVNALVRHVRPDYPMPGVGQPQTPETAKRTGE